MRLSTTRLPDPSKHWLRVQAQAQELNICTNKTCKKQGSVQIATFAEDLRLPGLTITKTGCLAKCGNGPNMVISPLNVTLSHVNTTAKMREVLESVAGLEVPEALVEATKLRLAGNSEARMGNLQKAADLYTRGLDLDPPHCRHLLLSNRSGVLLSLGRAQEAAEDAREAVHTAPAGFHTAVIRQVEAQCALQDHAAARKALEKAAIATPAFARTPDYTRLSKQAAEG